MISKLIRRTHMYLGLFLAPWLVMYALSTIAMNHRQAIEEWYTGEQVRYEMEREADFIAVFEDGVPTDEVAREVLDYLDMEGRFSARGRLDNQITINRHDPLFQTDYVCTSGRKIANRKENSHCPQLVGRNAPTPGIQ